MLRGATLGAALVALFGGASGGDAASRAKPDLAVAKLAAPPGAVETLEISDSVRVSGHTRATVVRYYLSRDRKRSRDDRRLGARTLTARSKAGVARLRVPATVPRGRYLVIACADDTRRVRERNERNNCRASAARVTLFEPFRPTPLNVTETLDTARSVSAEIGPAGGSLTTTAADGAQLTLDVPAGAVPIALAIRMTPLSGLAGLPAGGRVAAAARFEPEGLQLLKAATLTVVPASAAPVAEQLPFATESGRDFHAYPTLPDRTATRLPLLHFSTFGLSFVTRTEEVTRRTPSSRAAWAEQTLAKAILEAKQQGRGAEGYESAAYVAIYVIGNETVRPLLQQALTDRGVRREAIRTYIAWLRNSQLLHVAGVGALKQLEELLEDLFQRVFRREVDDVVSDCERGQTGPNAAFQIIGMLRQADLLGELPESERLAMLTRLGNCVRFELTMTTAATANHIPGFRFATVRVRAIVTVVVDPLGASSSQLAVPLEVLGGGVLHQFSCPATLAATPAAPFTLTGLQFGVYHAKEPIDPYFIVATFDPGRLEELAVVSCPYYDAPSEEPLDVYRPAFEYFYGPAGFRVTEWERVSGSAWAYESRFQRERTDNYPAWQEETRFFLRHAPASG